MRKIQDPQPKIGLLRASAYSPMRFMAEQLVFDSEKESLVRFRGPFQMPNWDGVEDTELDYEVDGPWVRLDILANEYYSGRVELMWVIAARNHLDLPDVQLYMGRRLKIPHEDWVDSVLLPQARFKDKA